MPNALFISIYIIIGILSLEELIFPYKIFTSKGTIGNQDPLKTGKILTIDS